VTSPAFGLHRNRLGAFSLLELLVVIGLIAIMLVAVVPAVNSLGRSSGRKGAVSNVMNAIEHARALAISSGRPTYVVFADQNTPEEYRCTSFIVFQDDATFTPKPITKWYRLPTGIAFRPNSGILAAQTGTPKIQFACPSPVGPTLRDLPFVKFDSSGMVSAPTGGLWIDIFAGFVGTAGDQSFTDARQKATGKYDAVVVSRFTGRVRYVDPYT